MDTYAGDVPLHFGEQGKLQLVAKPGDVEEPPQSNANTDILYYSTCGFIRRRNLQKH